MKKVLTIAGSDCSGGAGIQADIKTMSALGAYAMSVIISVVAENTARVIEIHDLPDQIISSQIDAIMEDIYPDAIKIGMLSSPSCMQTVSRKLKEYKPKNVVIDPVMYAKNGCPLMHENSVQALIDNIVPLADLLTPNIPEAERICGRKINTIQDMKDAGESIIEMGAKSVLIKGGHFTGDAVDVLYDGKKFYEFFAKRINTKNTHGTGCTLSSAIATNLAQGATYYKAVKLAKAYVTTAIINSLEIGKGNGPTNHFYSLYKSAGFDVK